MASTRVGGVGDPQWCVNAADCTDDALAPRATGSTAAKQGQQVMEAIAADSDALGPVGTPQGLPSVDEDDAGSLEAEPGSCSPTPNPAVAAIVTLGSPQRPPSTGAQRLGLLVPKLERTVASFSCFELLSDR